MPSLKRMKKEMNIYDQIRIKTNWAIFQLENDQRMKEPEIDVGKIVTAIGWTVLWFGIGVIVGGKL